MENDEISQKFSELVGKINENNWPVHGIQVFNKNKLLHSFGITCERFPVYSITKSILSMAVGIAEEEGFIDLSDCILKFMPEEYLQKMSVIQFKLFENITFERLLTMSVKGFAFRPSGDNWLLYSLNSNIQPDAREFHYNNICAYLTGVALTGALGVPPDKFIQQKIFDPLGIKEVCFDFGPEGFFNGASGIKLSVEELSKIGLLAMNNGVYDGKKIIPADYLQRATTLQIMNREGGYGYFFWKFFEGFSLNGKWGQKVFCLPEEEVMICVLSNFEGRTEVLKDEISSWFVKN